MQKNKKLDAWIAASVALCQPDQVVWWHGTTAQYEDLAETMVQKRTAIRLNPDKRPGCYLFRSDPSDVARVENRTFIASKKMRDAGPTNNWIEPERLKAIMTDLYRGSMVGRTMYVIPFSMGPIGSAFAKIGVSLTDSPYVALNMQIMTRTGDPVLEALGETGDFVPCLHSVGYPLTPGMIDPVWPCAPIEQKYISHFPDERLIWSYGSGYGGNALLGKKCFALRIASVQARDEGWLAEHMLILKLTSPEGKIKYVTGAFPSACGKTNLAMLVPTIPGWRVETVGDDIAWLRFGGDGRLYAVNPEAGFFGVAPGTSIKTNPNAMQAIERNTLFTNVALTDDGDVWWEGIGSNPPTHLIDWHGADWTPETKQPATHPNARFTAPASQCPVIAPEWENPEGVPISAILIGGRRPSTVPLVHESYSWQHGVFMGSIMGSEITAATISDQIGQVRRDPFAMLPFIGYHAGDYLQHWLDIGVAHEADKLPKIYYVNWFRKNAAGQYLWPGYGENSRILKWIFARADGLAPAIDTPIGRMPRPEDLDLSGLDIAEDTIAQLLAIDRDSWLKETEAIERYYERYGDRLPPGLRAELENLKKRL
ncbi:MAG: phosphoenolpyruvate carboxykinase (GTP) [bacterium]